MVAAQYPRPVRIDIILYEGFDELDAIGPHEVLRSAAAAGADFDVRLVARDGQPEVRAEFGLRVAVDGPFDGEADVVVVPGGGWATRADTAPGASTSAGSGSRSCARRSTAGRSWPASAPAACCSPTPA